jgi:hypothetical protein
MSDSEPKWMNLLGLTRERGHRQTFSLQRLLLSLTVMVPVAVAVGWALHAWTTLPEGWVAAVSVGLG